MYDIKVNKIKYLINVMVSPQCYIGLQQFNLKNVSRFSSMSILKFHNATSIIIIIPLAGFPTIKEHATFRNEKDFFLKKERESQ